MSRSDAYRLADMIMAADEIAAVVERGRDAFDADVVLRQHPASSGASRSSEINWSDMAKVRDRLSHHYHRVDP